MAYNILLVDDSETVRAVLQKTLNLTGIDLGTVMQAANGIEALAVLETNWVDVIFTDINMPEMGGVEFIQKLKEQEDFKNIPVIVVSTEGSKTRMEELNALGIRAYIRKPFRAEKLKEVVEHVLNGEVQNG